MSDKTKIEWTDATWNPVTGCTKVSTGCDHCYAEAIANRFAGTPAYPQGFAVTLRPERLDQPLRWTKPRRVFVNSMSDLFHKDVPDEFIARVWAVMALAPQHEFQVLTKRHGRMQSLLSSPDFHWRVWHAILTIAHGKSLPIPPAITAHFRGGARLSESAMEALPNVWLGVSVEDQKTADLRIPALLDSPAAVRWLSCEPLLGPVNLPVCRCLGMGSIAHGRHIPDTVCDECEGSGSPIDWVVVGGESGPGARPMHPSWALSLRDQCVAASVPFLFKQWGEWKPTERLGAGVLDDPREAYAEVVDDGKLQYLQWRRIMRRVGKKAAGRELDGRTWDEYPEAAS